VLLTLLKAFGDLQEAGEYIAENNPEASKEGPRGSGKP
jgi:hypothetical protein